MFLSDYCNLLYARSSRPQACCGPTHLSQLLVLARSPLKQTRPFPPLALLALRAGLESFAAYYSNAPLMIRYLRPQAVARRYGTALNNISMPKYWAITGIISSLPQI